MFHCSIFCKRNYHYKYLNSFTIHSRIIFSEGQRTVRSFHLLENLPDSWNNLDLWDPRDVHPRWQPDRKGLYINNSSLINDSLQVIILCFVVTDSLQGFILFWIFTFNKRVFDLYRNLLQRLRARSEARQEEKERLRRRAAILRQQSLSLSVKDLEQEDRKFPNLISCWGSTLENRARKESGASQNSTSTQATTVRSERWDCHTLKEEYEDTFPPLPKVPSTLTLCYNSILLVLTIPGTK